LIGNGFDASFINPSSSGGNGNEFLNNDLLWGNMLMPGLNGSLTFSGGNGIVQNDPVGFLTLL
jgi:hypothetical protein